MEKDSRIFVAGHRGMVGSAILQELQRRGYSNLLTAERRELDLCRQDQVQEFFTGKRPEYVFLAAAKVGGIMANQSYPADFIYVNTLIAANVINAAYGSGVTKLLNLGSSCIYPRETPQPMKEEYLLSGPLEQTNDAYAIAKISAIKMCDAYNRQYGCNFISAMPCNLYGPNDNFHLQNSHLLPALVRKMADAHAGGAQDRGGEDCGEVVLWGDGTPRRELLFSEDLADAVIFLMEHQDVQDVGEFINIGSGYDIEIRELADTVADIVGFRGRIRWDRSYPNGTMRKLMDCSKIRALGWKPKVGLDEGIRRLFEVYRSGSYREQ
ncbi:GDP-L-fucose synthase [Candidatus Haliotispira prima]|uniref:GDP-L-fucose synthase n=1 Tax=Candidatus Haliotispira prima TaxID=3034016 RepID=A0ABY8MFG2_9SPIO|nr:GDP-L-fucose synthase [Candidatus Haliotispira prima]